VGQYIEI